jgi:hypothetical protein
VAGQQIEEVKIRLDGGRETFICELVREDERGIIIRWRTDSAFVAGDFKLPAGAVTTAFYWRGRHHNLYRPLAPDGSLVCHRMDIIEPPLFEPGRLTFRDMALDILIPTDGEPRLEDEDELEAAVSAGLVSAESARELLMYAQSLLLQSQDVIDEAHAWLAPNEG